jgi:RNA polymerase sigma-70 factor (ECF subfamily)
MNFALNMKTQGQESEVWDELETVIKENHDLYHRLARNITKSDAVSEDVLQNVRLKLLRTTRDGSGDNIRHPKPFIYRAVQNFALNFTKKRQFPLFDEDAQYKIESNDINLDELLDLRNVCTMVGKLLSEDSQSLDSNARKSLRLYAHGLSYQEIAKSLNMRIGTVMSSISRGREKLKKALGPEMCDVY